MVKSQVAKMLEPDMGKRLIAAFEGCKDTGKLNFQIYESDLVGFTFLHDFLLFFFQLLF